MTARRNWPDADVRDIERERLRALVSGDVEIAGTFHHSDFQLITPRGVSLSLGEYLDEIATGGLRYLRWEPGEIFLRQSGEMAAVRYRAEIEMESDGTRLPVFKTWHTDVYERRGGLWLAVWSQATTIV